MTFPLWWLLACEPGPLSGFSSRVVKNQVEGPKTRSIKIQYWMYRATRGKTWNGGEQISKGGPGTTGPRCRRPWCEQRLSTVTSEKSSTKPVRLCCPLIFVPIDRCATILASLFISFQTKWKKILCSALSDDPNAITQQKALYQSTLFWSICNTDRHRQAVATLKMCN